MCGRYSLDLSSSKSNFKPETIKKYSNIFEYNNDNISPSSEAPIIIDQNNNYPDWNWLKRPNLPLKSFMND